MMLMCGWGNHLCNTYTTQLDLFAPGTVPPKQPVVRVVDSTASVDKVPPPTKQFSLADADDFEELGLSRDGSRDDGVVVHPVHTIKND